MTEKELKEKLEEHKRWLKDPLLGERLVLGKINLSFANLSGMNLAGADLSNLYLMNVNFQNTNLEDANLDGANLMNADLTGANLQSANLTGANLMNCRLENANLRWACLINANLTNVKATEADLLEADLSFANLTNTDFSRANLLYAQFDPKNRVQTGFITNKKMLGFAKCENNIIVALEIPEDAVVFKMQDSSNLLRTNKAKVIDISGDNKKAISYYDKSLIFEKDKSYNIKYFDLIYNNGFGQYDYHENPTKGILFVESIEDAKGYGYKK